jgi:hypothetical protein
MRISGFRRGVYNKIFTLLGRYAALIGSYQQPVGLLGPTGCPETPVTNYQSTPTSQKNADLNYRVVRRSVKWKHDFVKRLRDFWNSLYFDARTREIKG